MRYVVATGALVIFAVLVYVYTEKIARAHLGRTLRAMRDNENSAEALGKDDVSLRRKTLMAASAISGMGGALYALYTVDVLPATYNRVVWTFWPWVMVIMGGTANNPGVAIGVFAFWFLIKSMDTLKYAFSNVIPFDVTWLEYLSVGAILILILMLRPEGILREKPKQTLSRSKLHALVMSKTKLSSAKDDES